MDQRSESFNERIERRLTRMTCDVIADPSPAIVAGALDELTAALEEGGARDAAERFRQAASRCTDPQALPADLQTIWSEWFAEDEVRRDVEALAADTELASMFIAEACDHLATIETTLLKLEERPGDASLLDDVFRPFHTIKGNAGALGVATVQTLAHRVENLLDLGRSDQRPIGATEVATVLASVDLLTAMLQDLAARLDGRPGRSLRRERLALLDAVGRLIAAGGDAAVAPSPADMLLLEELGPVAVTDGCDTSWRDAGRSEAAPKEGEGHTAVKVDLRKLDALIDTVGELVIIQSLIYEDPALAQVSDERLTRNLAQLRRITSELQRATMSMRMVPIRQTFQKLARLVRDLSKRSGKPVELVVEGEDTELDRKLIEDINDPLMHMVRNSLDHGIEPPEARRAAGKPQTGRLSLRACHQGGSIVIEVADDGAGLNVERIIRKAADKGLVAADAQLTPAEIHKLIFAPGFSTAEQVTQISGRGVGMDVVKRNIDALRGGIDIQSEAGKGTTFAITLPLTLAILEGLLVSVGRQRFLIPTFAIRESLRPAPAQLHAVRGQPRLIQVRERLLPLVWLRDLFSLDGGIADPTEATVVVIEDDRRSVALVVDALAGKQEVVVKSLGAAFEGLRGVAGGAILGDGRIGLILDAHGLIELARSAAAQDPGSGAER